MLTVHPSIMLGSYLWDEDLVPSDEFDLRMAPLKSAMAERGLSAMLVYGDAREHQALAYFTNFIPRMRWAMALFPAKGAPRLLASMSSRDMPAMRTMTWVPDVKSGWEWKWFEEFAATLGDSGRIGSVGFELMTPLLFNQLDKTLSGHFSLVSCDDIADAARMVQRPREIAIIRKASEIARAASDAISAHWASGDDLETTALAGERVARSLAVQDVRTLVSRDGGRTLEPYAARFGDRPEKLLAYVAVKYLGYWAESFISTGASRDARERASRALDALIDGLEAHAPVGSLVRRVSELTGPQHPALQGSFGNRIGLSPNEGRALIAGSTETIVPGTTYALRVGSPDGAIASAMVVVKADGKHEILLRSDPKE